MPFIVFSIKANMCSASYRSASGIAKWSWKDWSIPSSFNCSCLASVASRSVMIRVLRCEWKGWRLLRRKDRPETFTLKRHENGFAQWFETFWFEGILLGCRSGNACGMWRRLRHHGWIRILQKPNKGRHTEINGRRKSNIPSSVRAHRFTGKSDNGGIPVKLLTDIGDLTLKDKVTSASL